MELFTRKYNREDFPILQEWFRGWDWSECDPETIPTEAYFICRGEELIAFSCFCKTDCNVAIMGFTLANPVARDRSEAIDTLLNFIVSRARELGYKYMNYCTDNPNMVERMQKQGFIVTDNATAYILLGELGGTKGKFFDE